MFTEEAIGSRDFFSDITEAKDNFLSEAPLDKVLLFHRE